MIIEEVTPSGPQVVASGGALPAEILPVSDQQKLAARTPGQSTFGSGGWLGAFFQGLADTSSNVSKALSTDDAKKALAVGAAYFLPGVGAQLGQQLVAQGLITGAAAPYATAIGTALTQAGVGVAQGQPFDTALTNATVNAVTSTGAPNVAQYISKLGATPEVANAVTSVGASGLATAAKGGSAADIEKNMTGALAGSAVTGLTGDKLSGAVVGGAVTGGPTGALVGAAGAAGAPKPEETEKTISGTGLKGVGSTPTKDTDPFGVKADYTFPEQPGLGLTENVPTTGGLGLYADPNLILPESLQAYKTAPSEMKAGEDGALVTRYTSGSASVVPESLQQYLEEGEPIGQKFVSEPQTYTTQTQDKTGSDLSIYSGKSAKGGERQATQLGTTLQAPFYPTTTLGQALTGYRGAGEIEGQKTGKPRRDVWNEESLRLKDALGL
jgi:hypothetical protein